MTELGVVAKGSVGDDRCAGNSIGDGEAEGDLGVVLFANLAAVLPGDADGVLAFLGIAGIVNDPGRDGRTLVSKLA